MLKSTLSDLLSLCMQRFNCINAYILYNRSKLFSKRESRGEVIVEGQQVPSPPASRSGERCELPIGVWAEHRLPKGFPLFLTQDSLFLQYNIVNCGSQKIEKFLSHSILSQLLCIWWCCMILLVYKTKFTVRKSKVMVFTADERSLGGNWHFGEKFLPSRDVWIKHCWWRKQYGHPLHLSGVHKTDSYRKNSFGWSQKQMTCRKKRAKKGINLNDNWEDTPW